MTYTFPATGTIWRIEFFNDLPLADFSLLKKEIDRKVKQDDDVFSRFNPTSELSTLNKNKRLKTPSMQLFDALLLAEDIRDVTRSSFTPFIGTYLNQLGYDASNRFALRGKLQTINEQMGRFLNFDSEMIEISNDAHVDVSSFAKGIMVDNIVELIRRRSITDFLVNAGGDIYVSTNSDPIEIAIESPIGLRDKLKTVRLKNQAIATSANNKRTWIDHATNEKRSHIKGNAGKISQVSVVAKSAKIADLLSTVLFITGESYINLLHKRYTFEEYRISS